jgi:hypothetical protein
MEFTMNKKLLPIPWFVFLQIISLAAVAQNGPSSKPRFDVGGKWQLSWQARIGMEKGTLALQQNGTKLEGRFHSELGSPAVSGTIKGQNISFKLLFNAPHPFAITFTGRVDGNKMNGQFELDGLADGYDQHGENVQTINYSWTATLLEAQ